MKKLSLVLLSIVLTICLLGTVVTTVSAASVTPTLVADNPDAEDLGYPSPDYFSYKVDPADNPGVLDPGSHTYDDGTYYVEYTISADGKYMDFENASPGIVAVFMKGGNQGGYLYEYDPAVTGDTNLYCPPNLPSGGTPEISHILFIWGEEIPPAEKTGSKFNDLNKDGVWDNGEPGLPGWTIYVDYDGDGELDADDPSAVTGADGSYTITGITPGTYKVREVDQIGWFCSLPTTTDSYGPYYLEEFVSGETQEDNNFGNYQEGGTQPPSTPPEVGGEVYPVNPLASAAPFIGLTLVLAAVAIVLFRRRIA